MTPAWSLLLLLAALLCAADVRGHPNMHTSGINAPQSTQCTAEFAPVCVAGGLWVMNSCLAAAQKLTVVNGNECSLETPTAFVASSGGMAAVAAAQSRPQVLPAGSAFYRKHGRQFVYLGLRAPDAFKQWPHADSSGTAPPSKYHLWNSCILEQATGGSAAAASDTSSTPHDTPAVSHHRQAEQPSRVSGWWHWWCSKPKPPPTNPPAAAGNATCLVPTSRGENLTDLATGIATSSAAMQGVQPAFYGPTDDSVKVSNPVYPFTSFVKVSLDTMELSSKKIYKDDVQCSGTVISRTSILTAAHCVFFRGYEGFIALAGGRVIIGDKVDPNPQVNEVAVWSYMKGFPKYPPSSFENWRFDLAVLNLVDPIEDRFVTVPVLPPLQGPSCWSPTLGNTINAAGYPMEYPRKKQQQQWMHSCELVGMYPRIIRSTCDTLRGQSGGPVWFTGRDAAGMQHSIVVAIVVGGEPGPTPPLPDTVGLDVEKRIDAAAYEFLKQRAGRMFNVVSHP